MHRRRVILVITVATAGALVAFVSYRLRGTGMKTAAEMQHALLREIPVGTPVNEAESRLQKRGFDVLRMTNAEFSDDDDEHLDYLYGDMSEGVGLVTRRWQVAVIHQQGAVTEIRVTTGLTGP